MVKNQSAWRSPWVIGWAAIVLVVLLANLVMILLAIDANPGLVVEDYYERGQAYEKNMLSRMKKDPGWQMKIGIPEIISTGDPTFIRFSVMDKSGQSIEADSVTLYAYRPSDAGEDFSSSMQKTGPGRYQTEVSFPLKGVWDLLVSVQQDGEEYNEALRISVKTAE